MQIKPNEEKANQLHHGAAVHRDQHNPPLTVGAYAQERMAFSPALVELFPNDNIEVMVFLSEPIIASTTPAYVRIAL